MKFVRYVDRKKVFTKKEKLQKSGISIAESSRRMECLNKARQEFGLKNVWAVDGRIIYLDINCNYSRKPKIYFD